MDRINKSKNKNDEWKEIKDRFFGMDYKDSLQSVHFAKTENSHLNEYPIEDSNEQKIVYNKRAISLVMMNPCVYEPLLTGC